MKKQVYYLQDPPADPFLVNIPSDLDKEMMQKYAYLENEDYKAYRKRERRSMFLIAFVCLFLAGLLYLLVTVPAEKIDSFLM